MLLYTLPLIAALTGYITNFIAVKMLFHPREKVNLLLFSIQGIFPKRQKKLAEKLGKIVSTELFSVDDIKKSLTSPESQEEISKVINNKLDDFLDNKLAKSMPMLAMFLNDDVKSTIKKTLLTEFEEALPEVIDSYVSKIEEDVDVEKVVYEKVVNFSTDKLEEILYSIMKKEFVFIEILGGVLGFFIGLIQLLLVKL